MNAFVYGSMDLLVPLLMIERGLDIESMGLIFAALPIISQLLRMTFGIISDFIGRKIFYELNSVMNLIFMGIYYFSYGPYDFLMGKLAEGVRNASLWAVNRAYFLDHSYEQKKVLIQMRGVGSIFSAVGTIAAGALIAWILFESTIIVTMAVAVVAIPQVLKLEDKVKKDVSLLDIISSFDIRGKNIVFKRYMLVFLIYGLGWGLITGYVFPLFLKIQGYESGTVGLILGIRSLVMGLLTYYVASRFSGKKMVLYGGLVFALSVGLLMFSTEATVPLLVIFTGLAEGFVAANFEYIFVKIVNKKSYAGDIGILMFGMHAGMSFMLAISGFVISSLGFGALFFVSAIFFGVSAIASYDNLK
ncbi:MAG: MFS transporter [Kosmotogaceae bacterium]|nr:MFS transporter [Kosmotogaceae bacterium]